MRTNMTKVWILAVSGVLLAAGLGLSACSDDDSGGQMDAAAPDAAPDGAALDVAPQTDAQVPDAAEPDAHVPPTVEEANVDVLIMVDNSGSMANEQASLRSQFPYFLDALTAGLGGMPNLHVGVVTSDLGADDYTTIATCEEVGGDKGILGKEGDRNLGEQAIGQGQFYIADVSPVGCDIERSGNICTSHDCTQDNCNQAASPGSTEHLTLTEDPATGCPRCVNYSGSIGEVFDAYADVGTTGCGFEQQLEAVRKALDPTDPDASGPNAGFLRDDSFLVVLLVTDEDDCSAEEPDILFNPDPSQDSINSTLGPFGSFRCFEFGITCDVNDRTVAGERHDCVPRSASDPNNFLYPVDRYTAFLESLRNPGKLLIAAIAGPVGDSVSVSLDGRGYPKVDFSCLDPINPGEGATPAIRIQAVVGYFNDQQEMDTWAFTSVCSSDYTNALRLLGQKLAERITTGH